MPDLFMASSRQREQGREREREREREDLFMASSSSKAEDGFRSLAYCWKRTLNSRVVVGVCFVLCFSRESRFRLIAVFLSALRHTKFRSLLNLFILLEQHIKSRKGTGGGNTLCINPLKINARSVFTFVSNTDAVDQTSTKLELQNMIHTYRRTKFWFNSESI